jgi:hypothetical protein
MKTLQILTASLLLLCSSTYSQNRISVSNKSPIFLDFSRPSGSGALKQNIVDDSQWLNFTTLVNINDPAITITVQIVSGTLPPGIELEIEALPYKGLSKGNHGVPSKIKVSNIPKALISNIGTCYTGNSRNEGYQLKTTFKITNYALLKAESTVLYIQYTVIQ